MAALTSAQHVGLFMFLWIIGSVAAGELLEEKANQEVNAKPGENVLLQCSSSTDAAITKVEWKRTELEDDVFFFKDNKLYENYQDPRYRGRVQLKDPQMKNGDASVLLKNVSIYDNGTYKCWVITRYNNRWKRDVREFVRSVHLSVSEGPEKQINDENPKNGDANDEQPGGPRGRVGVVMVGLVGVGVLAGLVVKSKRAKEKRPSERVDEQVNVKLNP